MLLRHYAKKRVSLVNNTAPTVCRTEDNLIAYLRQFPNWVVWNRAARDAEGKLDKKPLRVRDLYKASDTTPSDWDTYEAAKALCESKPEYGLGFVLSANTGLVCIDLDTYKAYQPHITDQQRTAILSIHDQIKNNFPGTYCELSQSGKGTHIWCLGKLPDNDGRRLDSFFFEVYPDKRYIALGSTSVRDVPVVTCQPALDELMQSINDYKPRNSQATTIDLPEANTDHEILTVIFQSSVVTSLNRYTCMAGVGTSLTQPCFWPTSWRSTLTIKISSSGL